MAKGAMAYTMPFTRRGLCAGVAAGALTLMTGLAGCADRGEKAGRAAGSSVTKKRARTKETADTASSNASAASAWLDGARDAVQAAGDACGVAADERHVAASVIKLAILACALDAAAAGTLSLDEQICVREQDIVGGSGDIQAKGAGVSYGVDELLCAMIAQSDNVAANLMIERLGMDAVNDECERLGLTATRLERLMMDAAAQEAGRENYTSARDASRTLELIASDGIATPELCERARGYLLQQRDNLGIAEGVATGTQVAHKTGSLANAQHDAAIVYAARPYVLTVLTQDLGREQALELERTISAAISAAAS